MRNSQQAIADAPTKLQKQETTISLDNSRPGRPGLDELVPSRYALKVGDIDVMVVSDGVLSLPGAMLGYNVDPAVRGAWLKDNFLPPDVFEWALNVVVVRSGGRTGHWGLHGMRERAKIIGGKLEVWSSAQSGTEVEPTIPARVAYATASQPHSWFSRKEPPRSHE